MSAVVTGIGVIAPGALNTTGYWASIRQGRHSIERVSLFETDGYPCTLAGEIQGFDAKQHLTGRMIAQTDRVTRLSLVAADQAITDAGLDVSAYDPFEIGTYTASSCGGFEFGERELRQLWSKGGSHVSAYQSFAWFYAVNTGQISITHQLKGGSCAIVADSTGGLLALQEASDRVPDELRVSVAGSVDSALCSWAWVAQMSTGLMSVESDPELAYRPFSDEPSGYVQGEGGAILVIEEESSARERGATPYGRLSGTGATFGSDSDDLAKAI